MPDRSAGAVAAILSRARAAAACKMPDRLDAVEEADARVPRTPTTTELAAARALEATRLDRQYPDDGAEPPPGLMCSSRLP